MVEDLGPDSQAELTLPESVQGIIAARLDALPLDEKLLLQDASVVGKVFWLGALERIGGRDRAAAELLLHALERKDFVRRERQSSVGDETQYVFSHLLVRDVAYSQIPRAERSRKHQAAAGWIESLGRPEDHAEMLAHHYLTALELDRAAGAETEGLTRRARLRLREAGDRAFSLAAYPAAKRFYKAALELWPSEDPELAEVLFRHARSQHLIEPLDSLDLIVEARDALLAAGERAAAAEAEVLACEIFWLRGQRDTAFEKLHAAEALAEGAPTSYSTAYVAANLSRFATLAGESDEAIRQARKAMEMAEEIGNDALRAHALNNIGIARITLGDFGGLDDLEECVRIAVECQFSGERARLRQPRLRPPGSRTNRP